ncbi:hypothetical protein LCGC14_2354440 [marine sediment metagenome]|uniref:Zona occludens toxin N-terminal domain-containing protein n=1 Tax=marine sediment metagenome TaxID=412755 RepID=A0A0F9EKY1_9ZZZZ
MITIILGNVGSGKTALAVREMAMNLNDRKTYSNIQTKLPNQINISPDMIIHKEIKDYKVNKKTGESEPVYEFNLNVKFWKSIKEPINIILDEAHTILNSRRSSTKTNIIVTDWLSLIRRVLGSTDAGFGELTFITQLIGRIDLIARDMATNIIYCICHFAKTCENCGATWRENSEMPEGFIICPICHTNKIQKHSHRIEVWHFPNMKMYVAWHEFGQKTYYKRYYVNDIETYFPLYNTLQWDNMFSNFY